MTVKNYYQKRKRRLKAIAYTTITLWIILIIIFALKAPMLEKKDFKKKDMPDFQFEKVKISQINGQSLEWQLEASSGNIRKHKGKLSLYDVTGNFFKDNEKQFTFKSPSATLFDAKNILIVENTKATLLSTESPIFIRCNSLTWKAKKKTFYGKGNIEVFSQDIYISGKKLVATLENKKIKVSKQAIAEITIK